MSEHIIRTTNMPEHVREALSIWCETNEEIVRCRDCKYYTPECMSREEREYGVYEDVWEPGGCFNPERRPHACGESGGWHVVGIDTPPDGFCAWGERKED